MDTALLVIRAADLLVGLLATAGLSWQQFAAAKAQAEHEGRELGPEDVQRLLDESQAAIDDLRNA